MSNKDIAGSEQDKKLRNVVWDCIRYNKFNLSDTEAVDTIMDAVAAHDTEKKRQLLAALPSRTYKLYGGKAHNCKAQFTKAVEEVYSEGGEEMSLQHEHKPKNFNFGRWRCACGVML